MSEAAAAIVDEMVPVTDKPDFPVPKSKDPGHMLVEIDCRVMATPIPGGNIAVQGRHLYRMPKFFLPVLMQQVISDDDKRELERCTAMHEQMLARHVEENAGRLQGVERQLKEEQLRATYGGSPEALFHRDTLGKNVQAFWSVKVIDDTIPAPIDESAKVRARETAELVASVLPKSADMAAVITATIEALAAKGLLRGGGQQDQQKK